MFSGQMNQPMHMQRCNNADKTGLGWAKDTHIHAQRERQGRKKRKIRGDSQKEGVVERERKKEERESCTQKHKHTSTQSHKYKSKQTTNNGPQSFLHYFHSLAVVNGVGVVMV